MGLDEAEKKKKIDKTVCWLNKYGNLKEEIDWESVSSKLKKISYKTATWILREVEEQAAELRNPTGWIIRQCNQAGAQGTKEGRRKIETTVWWWNNEGGLDEEGKPIDYTVVAE